MELKTTFMSEFGKLKALADARVPRVLSIKNLYLNLYFLLILF